MAVETGEHLPPWLQHIPRSWTISLVVKARISFITLFIGMVGFSIQWIIKGDQTWITGIFGFIHVFLLGQTRYVNIPLFALFEVQRWLLQSNGDEGWLMMTCLWMQHVSFFALGNSNSLSSIDLSNAYNGISSYSIPLVGALTFISNWAGPMWWIVAAIQFLQSPKSRLTAVVNRGLDKAQVDKGLNKYAVWMVWCGWFHGVVMCFLVATCILLRTHLFIWTVFSPKFLFQAVWMGFAHVVVEGLVGGLIWMAG
jgi:ethanolaminephosphotransferase